MRSLVFILFFANSFLFIGEASNASILGPVFRALKEVFSNAPTPRPKYEPPINIPKTSTPRHTPGVIVDSEKRLTGIQNVSDDVVLNTTKELKETDIFYLEKKLQPSIDIQVIAPNNEEEFRRIFGRPYREYELRKIRSNLNKFETNIRHNNNRFFSEGGLIKVRPASEASKLFKDDIAKKELISAIENSENDFFAIIGHNQDGNLILHSGEKVSLTKLSEICNLNKKRCIFLSCDSNSYELQGNIGVNGLITYSDAFEAFRLLVRHIKKHEALSMEQQTFYLSKALFSLQKEQRRKMRIKYISFEAGKYSGIGLASITAAEIYNSDVKQK